MLRVLVNIRGCNGAGKSTVPMQMIERDGLASIHGVGKTKDGKPKAPYITVMPELKWVALGHYKGKTGGMDTISTNEEMMQALEYAWRWFPSFDIVMEGVIASTIRSTYIDLFNKYKKDKFVKPRREIIVMNFLPPLPVCLERIQERNGGKAIDEKAVESKWNTVKRNVDHFRAAGITSLKVNTAKIEKEDMLDKFLEIVERYRGGK